MTYYVITSRGREHVYADGWRADRHLSRLGSGAKQYKDTPRGRVLIAWNDGASNTKTWQERTARSLRQNRAALIEEPT